MSVNAALAAMDTAEQEARELLEAATELAATELAALLPDMATVAGWARDRLRLIRRDRATLDRHEARQVVYGDDVPIEDCARAAIDYWTEDA